MPKQVKIITVLIVFVSFSVRITGRTPAHVVVLKAHFIFLKLEIALSYLYAVMN